MAQAEIAHLALTLADLHERFGPMPAGRIRTIPAPGTATEDDVVRIEVGEDRLCELVDGVLVEKTVGYFESYLAGQLIKFLGNYVDQHGGGVVSGEAGMLRLFPGLIRIPDVAFASWERLPADGVSEEPVPDLVPDLVVEVISENNTDKEMSRKLSDYFEAGLRLVWYFYPKRRSVEVFTNHTSSVVLGEADTLTGGDVLPGFSLPLRDFFAKPRRKR